MTKPFKKTTTTKAGTDGKRVTIESKRWYGTVRSAMGGTSRFRLGRSTARKKKTRGGHPDRNAQFENIGRLRGEYQAAGEAVISVATKKKEWLGNFHRPGSTYTKQTVETFDHAFPVARSAVAGKGRGKLIPHGIYDLANNHAHINTSHDTGELCCDRVALW